MSKQTPATTATATKTQQKHAPAPVQEMVAASESAELLDLTGTASFQGNAHRLGNPNLQRLQRQMAAGRIGAQQGNRQLGKLVSSLKQSELNAFPKWRQNALSGKSGERQASDIQIHRKQIPVFQRLSAGNWYEYDMLHWARDIDKLGTTRNSFVKAAIYNTKNGNSSEYATIAQRSAYYDVIDALAESGILPNRIRFFGAAAKVTGKTSIGSVDGLIGWSLHSEEAIRLLKKINRILFESNMKVVKKLMANQNAITDPRSSNPNQSISALQFDLKMVEMEQGIVEEKLAILLAKIPDGEREEAITDINDDLNLKGFWRTLGEITVADTQPLEWAKKISGVPELDFLNRDHREAIGKASVLFLHKCTQQDYRNYMQSGVLPQDNLPEDYRNAFSMGVNPK